MTASKRTLWKLGAAGLAIALAPACGSDGPTGHAAQAVTVGLSTFEIDGNLIHSTGEDWDTASQTDRFVSQQDLASGSGDNSFGQGAKEDDTSVAIVSGSIPRNKSDLDRFYLYSETVGSDLFLAYAWERLNTIGTANIDLELSKVAPTSTASTFTLHRSAGDVLLLFDFATGGTGVSISLSRWVTTLQPGENAKDVCEQNQTVPCWGAHETLSASEAAGAVNDFDTPVSDPVSGNTLAPRTFGEAVVDLTAAGVIDPTKCSAFSTAFVKSRSSTAFEAEMKDFIPPVPVNLGRCSIKVHKQDDAGAALGGATFQLFLDTGTPNVCDPNVDTTAATDSNGDTITCTSDATTGDCSLFVDTLASFCIFETAAPPGYDKDTAGLHVTLTQANKNADLTSTPFVNPRRFKILVFVCREVDNKLYASDVTVDGTKKSSLATGALPNGITESTLCQLTSGAVFSGKHVGDYPNDDVNIK